MKGKCKICGNEYTQSGMSRHLKSCLTKNYENLIESDQTQQSLYYHIYVKFMSKVHTDQITGCSCRSKQMLN